MGLGAPSLWKCVHNEDERSMCESSVQNQCRAPLCYSDIELQFLSWSKMNSVKESRLLSVVGLTQDVVNLAEWIQWFLRAFGHLRNPLVWFSFAIPCSDSYLLNSKGLPWWELFNLCICDTVMNQTLLLWSGNVWCNFGWKSAWRCLRTLGRISWGVLACYSHHQ